MRLGLYVVADGYATQAAGQLPLNCIYFSLIFYLKTKLRLPSLPRMASSTLSIL